jgi:hypothetical protein
VSAGKSIDTRAPKGEYMIAFDTDAVKATGVLTAVKITIEPATLADDETARIDLTDHPLYPQLRQYVLSNLKNTKG